MFVKYPKSEENLSRIIMKIRIREIRHKLRDILPKDFEFFFSNILFKFVGFIFFFNFQLFVYYFDLHVNSRLYFFFKYA